MAISRMQEPQQIQSGIGSLQDPRQGYFLGKLVKKAGRAVKKITKSPFGKMALLGLGAYGLGGAKFLGGQGMFTSQAGRFGNLMNLIKPLNAATGKKGLLSGLFYDKEGDFSLGRTAMTGLGATALAAPFLMGDEEVEEDVEVMDPRYQVQRARNYYSGAGDAGAGLDFMPQKKYVMQNFYAADGGRAGFNMGGGQFTSGGNISPGTDVKGNVRDDNPFTGGGGGNNNPPPVVVSGGQGDNKIPDPVEYGYSFNFRDIFPGGKPFSTYGPIVDEETEDETSVTQNLAGLITNQPEYMNKINQTKDIAAKIAADNNLANGGRAGYANGMLVEDEEEEYIRSGAGERRRMPQTFLNMGGGAGQAQAEQMLMMEYVKYKNKGGDLSFEQFVKAVMQASQQPEGAGMEQPEAVQMAANGGRIGYAGGQLVGPSGDGSRPGYAGDSPSILDVIKSFPSAVKQIFSGETSAFLGGDQAGMNEATVKKGYGSDLDTDTISMIIDMNKKGIDIDTISSVTGTDSSSVSNIIDMLNMNIEQKAYGGRIGKQEGGIMATDEASEMIDMGGMEKDYRNEGGFVAMGGKERADDVPARLSKNEFVFTADAVRNAGGGDIDKGAEVMENLMSNLEQGGKISEESQGLEGAQAMYDQQQMLQSRVV